MSVHGNGEAGKSGQAEETDIYATQGDAEDLAWMEPVYRKFDEQRSILAEQKIALLKEAKRAEVHRVLVEEKLSDMCVRLDQLESSTNGLEKRLTALEGRTRMWESLEERSQTVLTELVTEMSREIQQQIKQDMELFERDLEKQRRDLHLLKSVYAHADVSKSAVQVKQSSHDTPAGTSQETPAESRRRLPSLPRSNSTTLRDRVVPETARPVQRPGTYSGDSLWESYYAQFEITAELNGWNEQQKAAYLATSLTGQALNVLGNLPADRHQNYKELVAALETRYGSTHRTELARVRFKHRVKQKDESLAAMAEDLERLGRLAYPDAPGNLQNVLKNLLVEFEDVFSKKDGDLGRTGLTKHKINVGDSTPIRQPARVPPLARREEAANAIKVMREQGIIEPSHSPWASPVVLVRKKDGGTRFCVDYRKLNAITKKDSYPLPRVDTSLQSFYGSVWFSTLDLKSGYWQVEMNDEDREKTAFTTGQGLWQFVVMPFGLSNAPATFERLMEQVLVGLPWTTCLVYLDDVIVHARCFQDELDRLREIFGRLRKANLKLNAKKCLLFQEEVSYLGHRVSRNGIQTDPSKTESVNQWPVPRDVAEVRSFLGFCSYYRRFVKSCAQIAFPLNQLLTKGVPFEWTKDCQLAFDTLKERLTSAPVLTFPCPGGVFILDTDASNTGLGAVLSQMQDGQERVLGYFSRSLSKTERNYCVTRRELLALVAATEHFNYFLYGQKFVMRTDHSALQWLMNFQNVQGQLARWLQKLQQYDFDVIHRAGKKHQNADALSRRPCLPSGCRFCQKLDEENEAYLATAKEGQNVFQAYVAALHTRNGDGHEDIACLNDVEKFQRQDEDLSVILNWIENNDERPGWSIVAPCSRTTKILWAQWDSLRVLQKCLYRLWEGTTAMESRYQLIVPKELRDEVLAQVHGTETSGHFGVNKTLQRLKQRFYWPSCRFDVKQWCASCDKCSSKKGPRRKPKGPLKLYNVGAPMERIAVDVMGPLPVTRHGNKYLVVANGLFYQMARGLCGPEPRSKDSGHRSCPRVCVQIWCTVGATL